MRALTLALALATPGGAAPAGATPETSQACAAGEVALRNLAERGGDPRLFSPTFPGAQSFAMVRDGKVGFSSGRQPMGALQRFDARKLTSALACPNVRARAGALGAILDEDAGQAQLNGMGLNGRTAYFWRIAMPVMDDAGREAVVAAYASSNQLAGGSELVFLTRQPDGSWKVTGYRVLSMS